MLRLAAACGVCAIALAGCGDSRAILYSGISPGSSGKRIVISDAEARTAARSTERSWLHEIAVEGRRHPHDRFANLSPAEFRGRLAAAAAKYGFTVESVRFLHPRQLAPLVIVRTSHYLELSRAIGAIERSVDPGRGHPAFEAFFFEGRDERGIPFVAVFNDFRGGSMGGQFARAEALYPGPHG